MTHNPPHPGIFLNETVIRPLEISVTEATQRLGMSRTALSGVLNGKAGISPDLAVRLERASQGQAQFWINLQANYDLWVVINRDQPCVIKLKAVA